MCLTARWPGEDDVTNRGAGGELDLGTKADFVPPNLFRGPPRVQQVFSLPVGVRRGRGGGRGRGHPPGCGPGCSQQRPEGLCHGEHGSGEGLGAWRPWQPVAQAGWEAKCPVSEAPCADPGDDTKCKRGRDEGGGW